jgi:hypothetical protein
MANDHDPAQQESYLRQALAQDKRPLGILLGAGCPSALKDAASGLALIPAIAGLTDNVRATLSNSTTDGPLLDRLVGHFVEDGKASANVEDYLGHVRALRVVAGTHPVRGFAAAELDRLDIAISAAIVATVNRDLPEGASAYSTLATWTRTATRDHPIHLFTTNYDLLLEQALERAHVPYFDGFVGAHRPFFDPFAMEEDKLPARWARVWKLHGSINWRRPPSAGGDAGRVVRGAQLAGDHFVIHPSHLKYEESRRMPYLAMIDRMRHFFKQPAATLLSCGFSFGDEHLNEVIANGLRGNANATLFGLLFGKLGGYEKAIKLTKSCPNLTLLAADGAVVGGRKAAWMPKEAPDASAPQPIAYTIEKTKDGVPGATSFRLGDFNGLGEFLDDLIRDRGRRSEAANGD